MPGSLIYEEVQAGDHRFRLVGYRKRSDADHWDYCFHDLTPSEARQGGWEPLYTLADP